MVTTYFSKAVCTTITLLWTTNKVLSLSGIRYQLSSKITLPSSHMCPSPKSTLPSQIMFLVVTQDTNIGYQQEKSSSINKTYDYCSTVEKVSTWITIRYKSSPCKNTNTTYASNQNFMLMLTNTSTTHIHHSTTILFTLVWQNQK